MDQQVALEVARNGGLGFGSALLKQLSPDAPPTPPGASPVTPAAEGPVAAAIPPGAQPPPPSGAGAAPTATAEAFVARYLPQAEAAARKLGVEPRLLLAQAALETGWGAAAPQHGDGRPTNNLFGIKAGAAWRGERAAQWTLEQVDGVAERRREEFRAYPSSAASFADYVELIGGTPRYAHAVASARDAEAYARAVTAAGYATDPGYADKWLSIYHGDRLDAALRGLKAGGLEPTHE
jgi:flagellar protein FlgJ